MANPYASPKRDRPDGKASVEEADRVRLPHRSRAQKPTRDGDRTLVILTNLPVESADAIKIAELYRTRWKIDIGYVA